MTRITFRANHTGKSSLLTAGVLAALLSASVAHAQLAEISEATLTATMPTDVPLVGSQPTMYSPSYTITAGSLTLTFTNNSTGPAGNGNVFERENQLGPLGGGFGGDFTPEDTPLLVSAVTDTTTNGATTITFSSPISAFGFNFDPQKAFAETDFRFTVFEGANSQQFNRPKVMNFSTTNPDPNFTVPFFGVQDTSGNKITSLEIFGAASAGAAVVNTTPNQFAVGLLRFNTVDIVEVPEPGVLAFLAAATLPLGLLTARRRRAR